VATYFMRENLASHVARLVEVYRAERDAMLRGLWEVLSGTDVEISKREGGARSSSAWPSATSPRRSAARLMARAILDARAANPACGARGA